MSDVARPSVVPLLWYDRPREAIAWLEQAFGFETVMVVAGDDESVIHSELTLGNGAIYVSGPSGHGGAGPSEAGGGMSQMVCINLTSGIHDLCARARHAGADITREPEDQPYGDRVFACRDLEGHAWSFAQPAMTMTTEEMAAATGRKIETRERTHG